MVKHYLDPPKNLCARHKEISAFTMIELLGVIIIVAVLAITATFFMVSIVSSAKQTADKFTYTTLNDALTRYKCQGGDVNALTQGAPMSHVLAKLSATINWNGLRHQVLNKGFTYPARSLSATGLRQTYQFTKVGTYSVPADLSVDIISRLTALGVAPSDGAALKTWIDSAKAAAGTTNFLALKNPTDRIGFYVQGTGKLEINWGDGTTNEYTLTSAAQAISKNYGTTANRGVVLVGNITYFRSAEDAAYGGVGTSSFGGDISTMTGLTYLYIAGSNTLSGSVTNLTGLTYLLVNGSNTISGSVTNLTALTRIHVGGANTLSGSITNLTGLNWIYAYGSNSITGSINNLTNLTLLSIGSSSTTVSGSLTNLTNMQVLAVYGPNCTITGWEDVATHATGLCLMVHGGNTVLTSAQVNAILAGFWTNRNATKPYSGTYRTITLNTVPGTGAPTGQGLIDKAALQAYRSPNDDSQYPVWTVLTF